MLWVSVIVVWGKIKQERNTKKLTTLSHIIKNIFILIFSPYDPSISGQRGTFWRRAYLIGGGSTFFF